MIVLPSFWASSLNMQVSFRIQTSHNDSILLADNKSGRELWKLIVTSVWYYYLKHKNDLTSIYPGTLRTLQTSYPFQSETKSNYRFSRRTTVLHTMKYVARVLWPVPKTVLCTVQNGRWTKCIAFLVRYDPYICIMILRVSKKVTKST